VILLDLPDGVTIGRAELVLDDHRANDQSSLFCRSTLCVRQALSVILCQCVSGNALAHLYPPVIFIQGGLEGPVKFSEGELLVAVKSDHRYTVSGGFVRLFVHYYAENKQFLIDKSMRYVF